MMASARVDLPHPNSPTRPRHSPGFTSSVTPSTAFRVFTPPENALPTAKCTARSSSVSKRLSHDGGTARVLPSAGKGVISGATVRQISVTAEQRGLKRQPAG